MNYESSWIKNFWRPCLAYSYAFVCLFDFVIAPILSGLFAYATHTPLVVWVPITNQMYHTSMLAILTTSAYSRGQEKIAKIKNDNDDTDTDDKKEEK